MERSVLTLQTDQKIKAMTYLGLIGLFSLIIGVIYNSFKVGFSFTLLSWIFAGIIESSFNRKEGYDNLQIFSPFDFITVGLAGIGVISILMVILFLLA